MKYIVCEQPGKFAQKEKPFPIRAPHEALLKIKKVGICGTDLHAYAGNQAFFSYPRILGHELAAEVVEIDPNENDIVVGDPVVLMPYLSCGHCIACTRGKSNCCTHIQVMGVHTDGVMQEYISVPTRILLKTHALSYDEMAIVEPLAIGAHAIRRAGLKSGEMIAVMGCGPIGIGIMKLAQIQGAKVIAVDVNEQRLQYAKENMGIDHCVKAGPDAVKTVAQLSHGNLCTAVFDASGNKIALETGPDYMSHGGRFVMVGLSNGALTYTHPKIHAKETTLMCSRNATLEDFDHVINILDQFPTHSFITHNVHFTEMIPHFEQLLKPETGVMKAIVNFSD